MSNLLGLRVRRATLGVATAALTLTTSIVMAAGPASALAFSNQTFADQALSVALGSNQGDSRAFAIGAVVNPVLAAHNGALVTGAGSVGGQYYGAYQTAGAVAVDPAQAEPGDLIQTIADSAKNSDNPPSKGLHTAIVVGRTNIPGSYIVRDTGWQNANDVTVNQHVWNPTQYASQFKVGVYAWRFGSSLTPLIGTIVQYPGSPNTSWLVYPDLTRRWIPTPQVFMCLVANGVKDSGVQPASVLDQLPDQAWESATCDVPPPPTANDSLLPGQGLSRATKLMSDDGLYTLNVNKTDGSLTLSKTGDRVLWTAGAGSAYYVLQADGSLIGKTFDGRVTFSTGSFGYDSSLQLRADGVASLVNSQHRVVWSSNSAQLVAPRAAHASIVKGTSLLRGHILCSANGAFCLTHQAKDGSLVIKHGSKVVWRTNALDGDWLTVTAAGNLVDQRSDGKIVWSTHTAGVGKAHAVVSNSGTLMLLVGTKVAWSSR